METRLNIVATRPRSHRFVLIDHGVLYVYDPVARLRWRHFLSRRKA